MTTRATRPNSKHMVAAAVAKGDLTCLTLPSPRSNESLVATQSSQSLDPPTKIKDAESINHNALSSSSAPASFATHSKFFRDPKKVMGFNSVISSNAVEGPQLIESSDEALPSKARRRSSSGNVVESGFKPSKLSENGGIPRIAQATRKKPQKKGSKGAQSHITASKVVKPTRGKARAKDLSLSKVTVPANANELMECNTVGVSKPPEFPRVVRRRRSWTPVDDSVIIDDDQANFNHNTLISGPSQLQEGSRAVFQTLKESFQFNGTPNRQSVVECHTTGPTRRRKVELVETKSGGKAAIDPVKVKKLKRKPRTITDKATEQFRSPEEQQAMEEADRVVRRRSGKKARSDLSKDGGRIEQSVVSPEKAIDGWRQQDLVFGTSSQIMREDSPTTIREVQQAIEASASEANTSRPSWIDLASESTGSSTPLSFASSVSKNLWAAAARDVDGSLLAVEPWNFAERQRSAGLLSISASPVLMQSTSARLPDSAASTKDVVSNSFVELSEGEPSLIADADRAVDPDHDIDPAGASKSLRKPSEKTTSRNQTQSVGRKASIEGTFGAVASGLPDYESWSDADLKSAIEKYGFKPMKSRKPMIKKLQKCWNAMNPLQAPPLKPPAKGRLHKSHPGISAKPAEALDTGARSAETTGNVVGASAIEQDSKAYLFSKIQEAIKSAPATHDAKNLSWHEKILLYDPIVLEDLTIWLNSVGLGRVGVDDEVSPTLVRDWCEAQSICCLWRLNTRGLERSRY